MELKRVEEIITSPQKIEVMYGDKPVWLEEIMNEDSVYITVLGGCRTLEVPASELYETGKAE